MLALRHCSKRLLENLTLLANVAVIICFNKYFYINFTWSGKEIHKALFDYSRVLV
jgi:hypothetical protein